MLADRGPLIATNDTPNVMPVGAHNVKVQDVLLVLYHSIPHTFDAGSRNLDDKRVFGCDLHALISTDRVVL